MSRAKTYLLVVRVPMVLRVIYIYMYTGSRGQRRNAHEDGEQPQKDTVRVDQNPEGRGDGNGDDGDNNDDYMAGVSSRESMVSCGEVRSMSTAPCS